MVHKNPLVSIVIATLNSADTLSLCLKSIISQNYMAREVIIMDGASTDGTVDIIKQNEESIAYWESQPDRGIYHAWNKALDHCAGEFICFLGADDSYSSEKSLSDMMALSGDTVDLIVARGNWVDEQGTVKKVYGEPWSWKQMTKKQCFNHPGSLYHKRLFEKPARFPETYIVANDYSFNLYLGKDLTTRFLDKPTVNIGFQGHSWKNRSRALYEMMVIQSRHPDIGRVAAVGNFIVPFAKHLILRGLSLFGIERL